MTFRIDELPLSRVRQLRILGVVSNLVGGDTRTTVPTAEIEARLIDEADLGLVDLRAELISLKEEKSVDFFLSLGGVNPVSITTLGANRANEFSAARSSVTARRIYLRDVYLRWIYEQTEVLDKHPTAEDYLAEKPTYFGLAYDSADLGKAAEWLEGQRFIEGDGAWGYPGPIYPEPTAKGKWTVENDRSVNDAPAGQATTYNTTIHGSANVAQGSSHFQQQMSSDLTWVEGGLQLIDTIEQSLPAAADRDAANALRAELDAARDELNGAADPSRARMIFGRIGGFVSQVFAGGLGNLLSSQIEQLMANLP